MDTLAAYMQQESPSQLNNAAWKPTFRTSPSLPSSSSCSSPVVVASNTKGRKIGAKSRRLARLPRGLPLPNASGAQAVEVNLAANAARTGGSVPIELDPQRLLDLHREPLPLTQHQALLGGGSSLSVSPLLSPAPPGSSSSAQVSEFSFSTAHAHESSCAEQTKQGGEESSVLDIEKLLQEQFGSLTDSYPGSSQTGGEQGDDQTSSLIESLMSSLTAGDGRATSDAGGVESVYDTLPGIMPISATSASASEDSFNFGPSFSFLPSGSSAQTEEAASTTWSSPSARTEYLGSGSSSLESSMSGSGQSSLLSSASSTPTPVMDAFHLTYPQPSTPVPSFGFGCDAGGSTAGMQLRPKEVINLFDLAVGASVPIIPALSRPAFAKDGSGRFLCGTEEQHPQRYKNNYLIFGRIDTQTGKLVNVGGAPEVWTQPISNHVRDIQWVDDQLLIVAIASALVLMRIPQQQRGELVTINFPPFHKDYIREIAVSPLKRNLLLSGGFDGSVFVTDISRLCEDITTDQQQSENSIYPCGEVVGSVGWHPTNPWLASCTTDPGTLHLFDIRTDSVDRHQSLLYNTNKPDLYTHAYCDEYTLLLGYGDGQFHVFDMRTQRTVNAFQDPYQQQIGEIKYHNATGLFATFGVPEVTLWKYSDRNVQFCGHHTTASPHSTSTFKTSGEFLSHVPALVLCDSNGMLSYYRIA